jgi:hypothetical protein
MPIIKSTQNAQGLRAPCLRRLATIIGMLVVTMVIPVVGHSAPPVPFAELPAWAQQGCRHLGAINDVVGNMQPILRYEIEGPEITTNYLAQFGQWRARWSAQSNIAYNNAVETIANLANQIPQGQGQGQGMLGISLCGMSDRHLQMIASGGLGTGLTAVIIALIVNEALDEEILDGTKVEPTTITLEGLRGLLVSRLGGNLSNQNCAGWATVCNRLKLDLSTYLTNLTSCFNGNSRVYAETARSLRANLDITKISGTSSYQLGGNGIEVTKNEIASVYISKVTVGFRRLLAEQANGVIPPMNCQNKRG